MPAEPQGPPPHILHCLLSDQGVSPPTWKELLPGIPFTLSDNEDSVVVCVECCLPSEAKFILRGYVRNGWGIHGFNSTSSEVIVSDPTRGLLSL